jgi:hypothetical protein
MKWQNGNLKVLGRSECVLVFSGNKWHKWQKSVRTTAASFEIWSGKKLFVYIIYDLIGPTEYVGYTFLSPEDTDISSLWNVVDLHLCLCLRNRTWRRGILNLCSTSSGQFHAPVILLPLKGPGTPYRRMDGLQSQSGRNDEKRSSPCFCLGIKVL